MMGKLCKWGWGAILAVGAAIVLLVIGAVLGYGCSQLLEALRTVA